MQCECEVLYAEGSVEREGSGCSVGGGGVRLYPIADTEFLIHTSPSPPLFLSPSWSGFPPFPRSRFLPYPNPPPPSFCWAAMCRNIPEPYQALPLPRGALRVHKKKDGPCLCTTHYLESCLARGCLWLWTKGRREKRRQSVKCEVNKCVQGGGQTWQKQKQEWQQPGTARNEVRRQREHGFAHRQPTT